MALVVLEIGLFFLEGFSHSLSCRYCGPLICHRFSIHHDLRANACVSSETFPSADLSLPLSLVVGFMNLANIDIAL